MAYNFNISFGRSNPTFAERDKRGNWFYQLLNGSIFNSGYKSYAEKISEVLSNPAVLKVLTFRADVFSQVRINSFINEKLSEENVLYSLQSKPNYWQSWTDLHWDIEFFRCLGVAYIYKQNDSIYCLNPANIKIDSNTLKLYQRLMFSFNSKKDFKNKTFKYQLPNNTEMVLDLNNLYMLSDLSGTLTNDFFSPPSRLDALCEVVRNSRLALQSKGINLEFTQKYLISGQHNSSDVSSLPMSENEKNGIEQGILGSRTIHATESKIDFTHLVSNLKQLGLDEAYLADLTIIANMYGVDTDVLGISTKKSTYENKEKGIGAFIDYTLMPKVQQLTDLYEQLYELEDLKGSFEHLSFNQVFEAEKVLNQKTELEALKLAQELGVDAEIIKQKATLIVSE